MYSPLKRVVENPILKPRAQIPWESSYVFNPTVLRLNGCTHILYRAIGSAGLSVLGYASTRDGIHIDRRLDEPVYICRGPLSYKKKQLNFAACSYASGGSWSGCEDPRLTLIEDTIYMTYTAFNGWGTAPGVALSYISVNDFLNRRWYWQAPVLISAPNEIHKNWVVFPEKIKGKFAILHSITPKISIDYFDTLNFSEASNIKSHYSSSGRELYWDNWIRGVGPAPIKTKEGWLVLYHAMDKRDPNKYKVGALILDFNDPTKVLYRTNKALLEPEADYENEGFKSGVVYVCGMVLVDEHLYVYYGGADSVVCLGIAPLNALLDFIKEDYHEF